MSSQETILPPTDRAPSKALVIIIALLRGAAAAYYVFMAERRPGPTAAFRDSPWEPLQLADDLPKQTTGDQGASTQSGQQLFLNQNFSVSVGASPIDEVDEGKGEGWKEHLTWEVRCDSL